MGTMFGSADAPNLPERAPATIHRYFSNKSWIEGAALDQLEKMSRLPGVTDIAAFPDLHPGKYGATGVALLSQRLHPLLIGNDIGCGMSLFELDLPHRKLKIDKASERLRRFDEQAIVNPREQLAQAGLPDGLFQDALGTIGGGNHFCELQAVESLLPAGQEAGLDSQMLYLLVHSGSRGFGAQVFTDLLAQHKDLMQGFDPQTDAGADWLNLQDQCVAWASLNRRLIAQKAATVLRADWRILADVPHNLVRRLAGGFVHYKGAAAVSPGEMAPVAGSRATLSYIVRAGTAVEGSLGGISHGAGRKYDRATMHGRVGKNRSERDELLRNSWGGVAICDDRNLVIEEASSAYKDAAQVVADLQEAELVDGLAAMRPLVTYKKATDRTEDERRARKPEHRRAGRNGHDRY